MAITAASILVHNEKNANAKSIMVIEEQDDAMLVTTTDSTSPAGWAKRYTMPAKANWSSTTTRSRIFCE